MKSVHIGVPVLKRYDLLRNMLESLKQSTVAPTMIHVIDNGRDSERVKLALSATPWPTDVYTPHGALGIAESWNWFIQNLPEERFIVNDDLLFSPTSLAQMLASTADLVLAKGCGFSCFLIRDTCVKTVGLFDETISPGYGYYEDDDYLQRIDGRGTRARIVEMVDVECGVTHLRSQTLAMNTPDEMLDHHRRFSIAQRNYMKKHGLTSLA